MASFPLLKTGAVSQYPLETGTRFQTEAVRFLDGSQQKFRLFGPGLRRWSIKLDALDDGELAALIAFVEEQGVTPFAFSDPATGLSVLRCVTAGDSFEAGTRGELRGNAQISIEEIP